MEFTINKQGERSPKGSYLVNYEYTEDGWNEVQIRNINTRASKTLSFSADELVNCCGIVEFGNIRLSEDKGIPNILISKILKELLVRILNGAKNKNKVWPREKIFCTSLINNTACNVFSEAIKQTGRFKLVREFRNRTGNVNKFYVSK